MLIMQVLTLLLTLMRQNIMSPARLQKGSLYQQ